MPTGTKAAPGMLSREIAAILRARLGRVDATKQTLADAVGISRSQVSAMLIGKKHMDIEQLDAMCWAVGLKLIDVVTEADRLSRDRHVTGWKVKPLPTLVTT